MKFSAKHILLLVDWEELFVVYANTRKSPVVGTTELVKKNHFEILQEEAWWAHAILCKIWKRNLVRWSKTCLSKNFFEDEWHYQEQKWVFNYLTILTSILLDKISKLILKIIVERRSSPADYTRKKFHLLISGL